jgi:hypothetical protein
MGLSEKSLILCHFQGIFVRQGKNHPGRATSDEQDIGRVVNQIDWLARDLFKAHRPMNFDHCIERVERNLFNWNQFDELEAEGLQVFPTAGYSRQIVFFLHHLHHPARIGPYKGIANQGSEQLWCKGVIRLLELSKECFHAITDLTHLY